MAETNQQHPKTRTVLLKAAEPDVYKWLYKWWEMLVIDKPLAVCLSICVKLHKYMCH